MGSQTILSRDIPQANAIERVHLLAQLLHSHQMERVADEFSNPRDRAFYFHAARVLGFIGEGEVLTPWGKQLATTEGTEAFHALAAGFARSVVGGAWMTWADVNDVRHLDPLEARVFLAARCKFSRKTQKRRASTLAAWVRGICAGLPVLAIEARARSGKRAPQLAFTDLPGNQGFTERPIAWPSPSRFPHNEDGARVGEVLETDLSASKDVLIVSGYSGLDSLIQFLGSRNGDHGAKVRLLLGTEPFPAKASRFRARGDVGAELRDYWLERGISVLLSGALLHLRQLVSSRAVEVRTARSSHPVHAKMYVSATAVTLGSSNFTTAGLGRQSEANVRFPVTEKRRFDEAQSLAEGLWARGADYTDEFLRLLDALLRSVSWQEALARACASILEGDWAKRYVPPALLEQLSPRIWRHQLQGISQAMWVLENVGSVLIADATGSGKTRMGAWLIRGAFDRQYRLGFVQRPAPLILSPPQVAPIWEQALHETGLNFQVESHGPLSTTRAARHDALVRHIGDTELLAVDEAHNFVNRSDRTLRLVTHYAENVILFTATPINRGASDLLSLIELLGADNLSDSSLEVLATLRRGPGAPREPAADFEVIRQEIRRFTVRRTRRQLNEIADSHPDEYTVEGRQARYPRHVARYFGLGSTNGDDAIAREISALADSLSGVTRLGKVLRLPLGLSESSYVRRVIASARALARHHVMSCLRSSRAALVEHALGTEAAVRDHLVEARGRTIKASTGNMVGRSRAVAGHPPHWDLPVEPAAEFQWLRDVEQHAARARADAEAYREIGRLAGLLSNTRENAKVDHLALLLRERGLVIGFDSHVISLRVFEEALRSRGFPVECLTGEGGLAAKRRAVAKLGLVSTTTSLIALCTDAFSEGLNLQRASCVVHLDTPTVIRLAEQRAGRVDRMNSPHDEVAIWWPKDSPAFAPQRRDLLRLRHEVVRDLIGANLSLPEDADGAEESVEEVSAEELARRASIEAQDEELDSRRFYDAFRAVRELFGGRQALIPKKTYEHMRTTQAEVVACVSVLKSERPWCFFSVGGLERAAPRWVLLDGFEAAPELDLSKVAAALRERLSDQVETRERDDRSDFVIETLVSRLRECEHGLLPVRRRRALSLLDTVTAKWIEAARSSQCFDWHGQLRELREWLCLSPHERRVPFPDPGSIADAWLRLLRPRIRRALEHRKNRRRPWRLDDLLTGLLEEPVPVPQIWKAFEGIPTLPPVDERIIALIAGVDAKPPDPRQPGSHRPFGSR